MPRYLFIILSFALIPLAGAVRIWPIPSAFTSGLTIILSAAAFGLFLIVRKGKTLHTPLVSIFFILFGLSIAISALGNGYALTGSVFWAMASLCSAAVLCLTLRNRSTDTGAIRFYERASVVLGVGLALYCFASLAFHYLLMAGDTPTHFLTRLSGLWGQPNLSATLAWVSIFMLLPCLREDRLTRFGWVGIAAACAVIALAASRTSVLVLLLFIALLCWDFKITRAQKQPGLSRSGFIVVGLLVFMVFALPLINQSLYSGLNLPAVDGDDYDSLMQRMGGDPIRVQEHLRLFSAWIDLPFYQQLIGTGNYSLFSLSAREAGFEAVQPAATPMHSHNLYSMILVEQGLIGLLLVILATGWLLVQLFRIRSEERFVPLAGAIGAIFIHSNLEYPLWYPWFLHCMAILVLLIGSNDYSLKLPPSRLMQTVGCCLLLVLSLTVWNSMNQLRTIFGAQLGAANNPEEYVQLRLLSRDTLFGEYASLSKISAYGPDWDRLNAEVREIERVKVRKPLDVVLMRELVLAIKQGRGREPLCELTTDLARTYPFASPILLEKVGLMGPKTIAVLSFLPDCIDQGLAAWGMTLEEVAERNEKARKFYSGVGRNGPE